MVIKQHWWNYTFWRLGSLFSSSAFGNPYKFWGIAESEPARQKTIKKTIKKIERRLKNGLLKNKVFIKKTIVGHNPQGTKFSPT